MTNPLELILRPAEDGEASLLVATDVRLFTAARPEGTVFVPGESVGYLTRLGRSRRLLVPAGAAGRVASSPPERVHAPVEYGQVLYRLEPLGEVDALATGPTTEATTDSGALTVNANQTGRFWHRPSPDDAAFCAAGDELEPGSPIGLVEIMKTFTQVHYQPTGNLPARAKVTRVLVPDGGEVTEGDPLIEVEPA
jgi:biotin carboxyl carrier protein